MKLAGAESCKEKSVENRTSKCGCQLRTIKAYPPNNARFINEKGNRYTHVDDPDYVWRKRHPQFLHRLRGNAQLAARQVVLCFGRTSLGHRSCRRLRRVPGQRDCRRTQLRARKSVRGRSDCRGSPCCDLVSAVARLHKLPHLNCGLGCRRFRPVGTLQSPQRAPVSC